MKASEALTAATSVLTVKRVYGDPYEKDGVTVIPAAQFGGAAGGGTGHDGKGQEGEGGGFGVGGRPAGAYVIRDGRVSWRPAVDPNRIVVVVGLLAIAYVLSRPRIARARVGGCDSHV